MLTKTSEVGIQTLLYLSAVRSDRPVSPKKIAAELEQSPSYLSKITRQLVKADILTAHRGVQGGVTLNRAPENITLLDIVQALQGIITGNYCSGAIPEPASVCAYHTAMRQVHQVTVQTLTQWSVADLLAKPVPDAPARKGPSCKMEALRRVIAEHGDS